jgi:hypothetical protein
MPSLSELKMTERWELKGKWWLPGRKRKLSSGTLIYEPLTGARLVDVVGDLADRRPVGPGPAIIHGRTEVGSVTLFDSFCVSSGTFLPKAEFTIELVVAGKHVTSLRTFKHRTFHVRYSNLEAWMEKAAIHSEVKKLANKSTRHTIRTKWSTLWESKGESPKLKMRIGQAERFAGSTLSFSPTHDHHFIFAGPTRVETFYQSERLVRGLFDIFTGGQIQVERVWTVEPLTHQDFVIFQAGRFGRNNRRDTNWSHYPVKYSDIANSMPDILGRWFGLRDEVDSTLGLFLLGRHDAHLNVEYVFLSVMQALESFHRVSFPGLYMPAADYKAQVEVPLRAAIPSGIGDDLKSSLKKKFEFANEVSLRRRLKALVLSLPNDPVFGEVRNEDFRSRTVNTRNRYTHALEDGGGIIFNSFAKVYEAVFIWQEVLTALLLAKLGLAQAVVISAVRTMQDSRPTFFDK